MAIIAATDFGDKINPTAIELPRGGAVPVYDHREVPRTMIGELVSGSITIKRNLTLDRLILQGELKIFNDSLLKKAAYCRPFGLVTKSHMQSTKTWYKPWTWRNKPIRVIDRMNLKGVSMRATIR